MRRTSKPKARPKKILKISEFPGESRGARMVREFADLRDKFRQQRRIVDARGGTLVITDGRFTVSDAAFAAEVLDWADGAEFVDRKRRTDYLKRCGEVAEKLRSLVINS